MGAEIEGLKKELAMVRAASIKIATKQEFERSSGGLGEFRINPERLQVQVDELSKENVELKKRLDSARQGNGGSTEEVQELRRKNAELAKTNDTLMAAKANQKQDFNAYKNRMKGEIGTQNRKVLDEKLEQISARQELERQLADAKTQLEQQKGGKRSLERRLADSEKQFEQQRGEKKSLESALASVKDKLKQAQGSNNSLQVKERYIAQMEKDLAAEKGKVELLMTQLAQEKAKKDVDATVQQGSEQVVAGFVPVKSNAEDADERENDTTAVKLEKEEGHEDDSAAVKFEKQEGHEDDRVFIKIEDD